MSIESQRVKVSDLIHTFMEVNYPEVPVSWPNLKFEQPDDVFIAVSFVHGNQTRTDLGSSYTVRQISFVQIDLVAPDDTGVKKINEIAQALIEMLREKEYRLSDGDRLLIKPPQMSSPNTMRGFARVMLRFPLWRDERSG